VFLTALSIGLTCIYLWGVLQRRHRVVLSFGIHSGLALAVYAAGLLIPYMTG
jgi:cation:H+ antiporter